MLPNFTRHLSPMPQLHSVTFGIGCSSPSVVSRIRLRLRGTLPHPRILLSFFLCIIDASRPPNKETPYLFLSRDHKAAAAAARELASESDWSLSALSVFFQVRPRSHVFHSCSCLEANASRQSPTAQLHSVTPSVGCPSSSVASRIRLRLRDTLPNHARPVHKNPWKNC